MIKDKENENNELKISSQIQTEKLVSIEEKRNKKGAEFEKYFDNGITSETQFDPFTLLINIKKLEAEQEEADEEIDLIGDNKTQNEQNILYLQNLLRKSKQIIETIESKIESPDDDETTDDEIKKELEGLNDQFKLYEDYSPDKYMNCIDQFIENEYEIIDIYFN